ncbi:MAG: (d)CMP kinase [Oscillospiraceae bacterium]|jgi:cytidylate kinase|nr:(d)CMP kinase [Oscillospiraceae bacterium]
MKHWGIAIDGPSGAGKSTLAKRLAQELGFLYVDTGAIYRTVGLAALRRGVDAADGPAVTALLPGLTITVAYGEDGLQHMFLNGEDVTAEIRRNEVSACASKAASIPAVRGFLLEMQRRIAQENSVIMDGRDIGTVVLPQADLKIFLTAAPEERAQRRWKELLERGQRVELDQVLAEVMERDRRDSERETSPLRRAEDAVLADTTGLDPEESFQLLLEIVGSRIGCVKGEG